MKWISFLLVVVIVGCEVDQLPSCEGIGIEGEICKEYQYLFGVYNGVNEYVYDLDLGFLSSVTSRKANGSVQGVKECFYNEKGLLSSIRLKNSKGQLLSEKMLYYNDLEDLEKEVVEGTLKTEHKYYYEEGLLKAEVFSSGNTVDWIDSLEYYSESKNVYRKLRYVNNSLTEITYFQIFANNVLEERVTNHSGLIKSRTVVRFNDRQEKIEELVYSSDNTLLNKLVYTYFDKELNRIEKYNELEEEYEVLTYKRF